MRICRYGAPGTEKHGVMGTDGQLRDFPGLVRNITPDTIEQVLNGLRHPGVIESLQLMSLN